MIAFGREICGDLAAAGRREWLCTNGLGGFASGTVAGSLTRRYHGLLVAALAPPLGRTLVVAKAEETLAYDGATAALGVNRWGSGAVDPHGHLSLEAFRLDGAAPVWSYAVGDALLEKRVWMEPGASTTYVRYRLLRARGGADLAVKVFVNYRDYHASTHAGDWRMSVEQIAKGVRVIAFAGARPIQLLADGADAVPAHTWYRDFALPAETARGLEDHEDHLHAATFHAALRRGDAITLVVSAEEAPALDGEAAWARRCRHEEAVVAAWQRAQPASVHAPAWVRQLVLAADQFIVARAVAGDPAGRTVIAGYHWFGDWGRDTMIALAGLTLVTGRAEIARRILTTFKHFVDHGLLPNRFPDAGQTPEYNTVDATLWYVEAIRAYHAATGDDGLLAEIYPTLEDIATWHRQGTRHGIHVDPRDGLLAAGEPGLQLTWMDARVGDRVVTPRTGKPVEINALWYNALCALAGFARRLGRPVGPWDAAAEQTRAGFERFWNAEAGACYDVVDTPEGDDASLRPNQIFAVALPASPLSPARQRGVVDSCARRLLTSHGLRTLSPDDPRYRGHYGGDPAARDGAYHQGTVWGWLLGPFALAHHRVYGDAAAARTLLEPLAYHLADHGLGSISEIFDGDPPFTANGCIAQAWSVAETLRAWHALAPPTTRSMG